MLDGGWNSETPWRLYMLHLRDVAHAYHTLAPHEIDSFFRIDGARGDLHFLHEMVKPFFIKQ